MPSKPKSKNRPGSKSEARTTGKKGSRTPDEGSMSIEELVEYFKPESSSTNTDLPKVVIRPMQQQINRLPGDLTTDAPPPPPKPKPRRKPKPGKKQK